MTERFYPCKGEPLSKRGLQPPLFPETSRLYLREGYDPEPGLVDAVHVALTLGRPPLLTGPPGTGKTELAFSVAGERSNARAC
jgi:MoxR-like ATPase